MLSRLVRVGQPALARQRAHFGLGQLAERKPDQRQLFLRQPVQE